MRNINVQLKDVGSDENVNTDQLALKPRQSELSKDTATFKNDNKNVTSVYVSTEEGEKSSVSVQTSKERLGRLGKDSVNVEKRNEQVIQQGTEGFPSSQCSLGFEVNPNSEYDETSSVFRARDLPLNKTYVMDRKNSTRENSAPNNRSGNAESLERRVSENDRIDCPYFGAVPENDEIIDSEEEINVYNPECSSENEAAELKEKEEKPGKTQTCDEDDPNNQTRNKLAIQMMPSIHIKASLTTQRIPDIVITGDESKPEPEPSKKPNVGYEIVRHITVTSITPCPAEDADRKDASIQCHQNENHKEEKSNAIRKRINRKVSDVPSICKSIRFDSKDTVCREEIEPNDSDASSLPSYDYIKKRYYQEKPAKKPETKEKNGALALFNHSCRSESDSGRAVCNEKQDEQSNSTRSRKSVTIELLAQFEKERKVRELIDAVMRDDPIAEDVFKSYQLLRDESTHEPVTEEVDLSKLSHIDNIVYKTFVNPYGLERRDSNTTLAGEVINSTYHQHHHHHNNPKQCPPQFYETKAVQCTLVPGRRNSPVVEFERPKGTSSRHGDGDEDDDDDALASRASVDTLPHHNASLRKPRYTLPSNTARKSLERPPYFNELPIGDDVLEKLSAGIELQMSQDVKRRESSSPLMKNYITSSLVESGVDSRELFKQDHPGNMGRPRRSSCASETTEDIIFAIKSKALRKSSEGDENRTLNTLEQVAGSLTRHKDSLVSYDGSNAVPFGSTDSEGSEYVILRDVSAQTSLQSVAKQGAASSCFAARNSKTPEPREMVPKDNRRTVMCCMMLRSSETSEPYLKRSPNEKPSDHSLAPKGPKDYVLNYVNDRELQFQKVDSAGRDYFVPLVFSDTTTKSREEDVMSNKKDAETSTSYTYPQLRDSEVYQESVHNAKQLVTAEMSSQTREPRPLRGENAVPPVKKDNVNISGLEGESNADSSSTKEEEVTIMTVNLEQPKFVVLNQGLQEISAPFKKNTPVGDANGHDRIAKDNSDSSQNSSRCEHKWSHQRLRRGQKNRRNRLNSDLFDGTTTATESHSEQSETLSDGEVRCRCSASIGEIHVCRNANMLKSQSRYLKRNPQALIDLELGDPSMKIARQKVYNGNWVAYYVSRDPSPDFLDVDSANDSASDSIGIVRK